MPILGVATALLASVATAAASPGNAGPSVGGRALAAEAEVCAPPTDSAGSSSDPAAAASASASYTAAWNNVSAVNDGTVLHTGGAQGQMWGTYSANRPAQQWLQYDWSAESTLTGASMAFWSDRASDAEGDGVVVPRSWKLQSWDGSAWLDVALAGGVSYGRDRSAPNAVTFAQPVTTTRLRAVFEAATDGNTFAAMAVSEFGVTGSAPADPKEGTEVLASDSFNVGISRSTGAVYTLQNAADGPQCTNYVANPTHRPNFDVNDSRWTGDVLMKVDGRPRVTGLSDDIRTVSRTGADEVSVAYVGNAANQYGIRDFDLTETYALTGPAKDVLNWTLTVDNTSSAAMEIEDLGIPLLMNSWWDAGNQTDIYERNVSRHSFVADDGSYMYWQRPNGVGPYLVMVPNNGTSIEFKDRAHYREGPFAQVDPAWEGGVEFYIHSKSIAPDRVGQRKAAQYLPSTSATLEGGETATYGFTFRWAEDYQDMRNVLYEAGVVDVVSMPGMVVPNDMSATLAVRAKDGIDSVLPGGGTGPAGTDAVIRSAGERNGYSLYELDFPTLGENFVTVNYGDGRRSVLQYYSTEPIETLIETSADFIATKQQSRDKDRGYDGAYLQWDMLTKQQVTRQNIDSIALTGLDEFARRWMTGGSDDLGLAPAAYLAEKNAVDPDAEQISSIDYYIDNFLLGYLQNQFRGGQRTWNVYHWYDGGDGDRPATGTEAGDGAVSDGLATWRVMNSPHVWNTYFGMYRIAKLNPGLAERPAAEYLDMSYRTMKAYFEHQDSGRYLPNSSRDMASMGESTEPAIMDALVEEGRIAEASELETFFEAKYEEYAARDYPFASEASIDTTAFEATYTMAKLFDDDALANKVTSASLAARGTQPLWYYYGGDNRHMGESWWNLGYETQIGAWQQQDYLLNYDATANGFDPSEAMRSTYGAYLGGWANINSGQISPDAANYGAASWQYQSERGASNYPYIGNLNGWWAWSGESALGFWGGVRTAAVNVVEDSIVGTYAYGGDLTVRDGVSTIVPRDGVRQRLNMLTKNKFGFELQGATYTQASIADDLRSLTLSLDQTSTQMAMIRLRNLPAGTYAVTVDGSPAGTTTSDGSQAAVALEALGTGKHEVRIAPDVAAPKAVVTLTSSNPASAEGWYDSSVVVRVAVPVGTTAYRVEYTVNDGRWRSSTSSSSVTLTNGGTHTLKTRLLRTTAVVPGSETEQTVKIDRAAPGITATRSPQGLGTPRNPVIVNIAATDALSGVRGVEYRFNSTGWSPVPEGGVRLAAVGDYVVAYRASDKAGNVTATKSTTVSILPNPETTLAASQGGRVQPGQPVTLTLKGFLRYDTISLKVSDATWSTVVTDVNGTAKVTVVVPPSQPRGQTTVRATGTDPSISATAQLTVR